MHYIEIPQPAEFARLLNIWEASVRATHHFVSEEKLQHLKTMIEEQELFKKSDLFCTRNQVGEITGFAGTSGESLDMLFLHPAVIGTGVGKMLMRYAIDVRSVTRVDVNEQNEHALGFYEHFGFKVVGRSDTDDNGEPFPLLHMELVYPILADERSNNPMRLLGKEEPIPYQLLLLADEEMQAIERYIHLSDIYVVEADDKTAGVCVLYPVDGHAIEIKAIAVDEAYQNMGIGKQMLKDAECVAKEKGYVLLIIGTPTIAQKQLSIYSKAGFELFDVLKDFFITNYAQPIFEDGVKLTGMALLRKRIG